MLSRVIAKNVRDVFLRHSVLIISRVSFNITQISKRLYCNKILDLYAVIQSVLKKKRKNIVKRQRKDVCVILEK